MPRLPEISVKARPLASGVRTEVDRPAHWRAAKCPPQMVDSASINGLGWGEVDFLNDIEAATKLTAGWFEGTLQCTRSRLGAKFR